MDFINWTLKAENQTALQEALVAASMATETKRSDEQLKETPFLTVFDGLTNTSAPHIVVGFGPETAQIRKVVVTEVIAALQGTQSMQQAMDKAQAKAEELVA